MKIINKGGVHRFWESPFTLIVLILLVFIVGRASWNIRENYNRADEKFEKSTYELSNIKTDLAQVEKRIEYISTDAGIEAELRNRYRAIRPGEKLAVIIENKDATNTVSSSVVSNDKVRKSFWGRFIDFFVK